MKKIFYILFLSLLIPGASVNTVFAQETAPKETVRPANGGEMSPEESFVEEGYVFPTIKPELTLSGGYRFVGVSGSERSDEYEFLHNSITLGGEARIFTFPHRFHFDLDVRNRKDYFGDLSYAYKDIILFRGINRTLFHNLDNITLIDLNPATATPGADVRDGDLKFGARVGMSSAFLRFKTPDFPFHVYIDGSVAEKEGSLQQRSLQGSGYFNSVVRTSQPRDVDWVTKNVVIGANSHVGPVEIDLSHGEKRFDSGGSKVLFDTYSAVTSGQTVVLNAGVFPHNQISELKGSSNTLKVHTSYTGGLVASATFSKMDRKNEDSGAEADYFVGAGEVTWIPVTKLALVFRYRHREADIENSGASVPFGLCSPANNSSNTYSCLIKQSISSITDTVTGIVRYRPASGVTLRAEYIYEDIRRRDAEEWFVRESTQRNTGSLSADVRIVKGLNLKTKYTHREINDPSVNVEPERSDEGRISVSWIPLPWLNTLISYRKSVEKRDSLRFVHQEPVPPREEVVVESPGDREFKRDRFLGSVTVLALRDVSVTASYSYFHDKATEDLAYHNQAGEHFFDFGVPMKDSAHAYSLDVSYMPRNNVSLSAGMTHTLSNGLFFPADVNLTRPASISSFSALKTRETVYSFAGEYRFARGCSAGLYYKYSDFNDVLENPNDDVKDGRAHILLLTFSKRW